MKAIYIAIGIAVVAVGYIIFYLKKKENYGGMRTMCEDRCYSSEYYGACLNSCLQEGRADYMQTGSEYDVLGVSQVGDLDRGYGLDTDQDQYIDNQRFGLRGETAGR